MKFQGEVTRCDDNHLEFWTSVKIESLNTMLGKTSAWPAKADKKKWAWVINTLVPLRESKEEFKCRVRFHSKRARLLDMVNLWGGCKYLEDNLARRGWIYNDSPKWCNLMVTQELAKGSERRTEVSIEILDDGESL